MKRTVAFILCLLFILSGCSNGASSSETPTDITEITEEQIPGFENYIGDAQLEIFRTLIKANAYFVTDVFYASRLSFNEKAYFEKDSVRYFKVESEKFKNYEELKDSVYAVYTDKVAQKLLTNPSIYNGIDGVFCIDSTKTKGNEYNYDWDNFALDVKQASSVKCILTATVKDKSGNEKQIDITVVSDNGNWKLNDFYTGM